MVAVLDSALAKGSLVFSVKPLAFLGRDALVFLGETNQL
jgi:hypothetical protein